LKHPKSSICFHREIVIFIVLYFKAWTIFFRDYSL